MTVRHTYTLVRLPVEPCDQYPDGVPGGAITARRCESEARYWEKVAAAYHDEFKYETRMETLQ